MSERIGASVLCPYFVPTGIGRSERNRPEAAGGSAAPLTASQKVSQAMLAKAVDAGKLSAAQVATLVFDAVREDRFYIYSHPQALGGVQSRFEDLTLQRNPSDPFAARPDIAANLREALRSAS